MYFESVYDIQQAGCRYGLLPGAFAVLMLWSAFAWYRGERWTVAGGTTQWGYSPRSACLFFAGFALVTFATTWGEYFSLTRALRDGRTTTIEGPVADFHPAATIKQAEGFAVDGRAFTYCRYCLQQGFNKLRLDGSPIADGMDVQLIYIDDHILRLGIRRSQNFHRQSVKAAQASARDGREIGLK